MRPFRVRVGLFNPARKQPQTYAAQEGGMGQGGWAALHIYAARGSVSAGWVGSTARRASSSSAILLMK